MLFVSAIPIHLSYSSAVICVTSLILQLIGDNVKILTFQSFVHFVPYKTEGQAFQYSLFQFYTHGMIIWDMEHKQSQNLTKQSEGT